jgi:hypothetical protein
MRSNPFNPGVTPVLHVTLASSSSSSSQFQFCVLCLRPFVLYRCPLGRSHSFFHHRADNLGILSTGDLTTSTRRSLTTKKRPANGLLSIEHTRKLPGAFKFPWAETTTGRTRETKQKFKKMGVVRERDFKPKVTFDKCESVSLLCSARKLRTA